jgi:hypothetical protein
MGRRVTTHRCLSVAHSAMYRRHRVGRKTANVVHQTAVETPHFVRRDVLHDTKRVSPADRAHFPKQKTLILFCVFLRVLRETIGCVGTQIQDLQLVYARACLKS